MGCGGAPKSFVKMSRLLKVIVGSNDNLTFYCQVNFQKDWRHSYFLHLLSLSLLHTITTFLIEKKAKIGKKS